MSYCRFRNTLLEMQACLEEAEQNSTLEDMDLSEEEMAAFKELGNVCHNFLNEWRPLTRG
ncbi:hypothetical protein UFOVP67_41 [uncultured Caudovirales phage]|uniref:Uncharacterized protein n=1 Tax=uncultured Caudovirales phage TaxID=2100421 RepID=A0A6J5T965_9CAUD|nr:hypothetical protein UFOVP67_41 [uncultured Caudovirales phage]